MSEDFEVISPSYYRAFKIQPRDYAIANKLGCIQYNVVKYATRAGKKPGETELNDALKCLSWAQSWVDDLKREAEEQPAPRQGVQLLADALRQAAEREAYHENEWIESPPSLETSGMMHRDTVAPMRAVAQACTAPKAG